MSNWIYWALFGVTALLFCLPFAAAKWEQRQERRDAELWQRRYGGNNNRKVNR